MDLLQCKGAIFDLDGVITQTARTHFKAWKKTFDEYLEYRAKEYKNDFEPFTHENDYLPYVDGKPRYKGVESFLESRDIDIPYGSPSDSPGKETICGIGNKKNKVFKEVVAEDDIEIYQTTVSFIRELKSRGIKVGVASSSGNCKYVLQKTGLINLFKVVIGGIASKKIGLKGKPNPDIFLAAADGLKIHPGECLMVEDAISGVKAGKDGNFGLVIGVARNSNKKSLRINGADIVVNDMKKITYHDVENWFKKGIKEDSWNLTYYELDPTEERLRETLTTVGNGYFGTRGCFEGEKAKDNIYYPGTYIAGVYNKLATALHNKTIYNNDFVNCPNWLLIEIKIGNSDFINLLETEILHYKHNLNMKDAIMTRSITFMDNKGHITTIESDRIAGMHDPHFAAIKYKIKPHNYSKKITLKSTLDGTVINYGVARYRELNSKHLSAIKEGKNYDELYLHVKTNDSNIKIYLTAKNNIYENKKLLNTERKIINSKASISEIFFIDAKAESTYVLEKLVSIYTSKDKDVKNPENKSKLALSKINSFDIQFEKHKKVWDNLWDKADIIIDNDRFSQKVIRLHIYHLLVTASIHNKNIDAGVPARGLHGEAYRGHVFWDELFIFPFYNLHFPETTKSLLMYRYKRLDQARKYAKENGYEGAMYPWQTANDGKEETQILHYNPMSNEWYPDLSRTQRHISIAIAYNVWEYYYCTNDLDFLYNYGAEMMIEIARFWASITTYDEYDKKYHICGVMGPDEFHEKYHDANDAGVKDNSYTNIMVSWLIHKTIETIEHIPDDVLENIYKKIGFKYTETKKWKKIVTKIKVCISKDGIISQFDGYQKLLEFDWHHYKKKYDDIHRLDRILKSEGNLPDKYKVSKQADVLMLFYLLSPGQVKNILQIMGYNVNDEIALIRKNYEYYIKRTTHGSTLSYVVHSSILKYLKTHKKDMWQWFLNALKSDIYDTQGGTTAEGIHCGVMGGTIEIIIKGLAGINLFKDKIKLEPNLPEYWRRISFKILHRNNWFHFEITKNLINVKADGDKKEKITIQVGKKNYTLINHKLLEIPY